MEAAVIKLSETIQRSMSQTDWVAILSVIFSGFSLLGIVFLLIERYERKRPYLQASFELIRGNSVCIVIRNVGEVPAVLKTIKFSRDFVDQLDVIGKEHTSDKENLSISIHPGQKWVIPLNDNTANVMKQSIKTLRVTLEYSKRNKKRLFSEPETIDFGDYSNMLVYISDIDELRKEIKRLTDVLEDR